MRIFFSRINNTQNRSIVCTLMYEIRPCSKRAISDGPSPYNLSRAVYMVYIRYIFINMPLSLLFEIYILNNNNTSVLRKLFHSITLNSARGTVYSLNDIDFAFNKQFFFLLNYLWSVAGKVFDEDVVVGWTTFLMYCIDGKYNTAKHFVNEFIWKFCGRF